MRLDALTALARGGSSWDEARSARVLASTLRRREQQIARARLLRRGLALGAGAAAVVLLLLRGAPEPAGAEPQLAQLAIDDAGFRHD